LHKAGSSATFLDPEEHFASGKAENSRSFSQKIHVVNFFVKKKKDDNAAAGESGRSSKQTPGLITHRVTRFIVQTVA